MKPEYMARVMELFAGARALPPDQRTAYLAAACAEDETVRAEVDSLLRCQPETSDFLAQPAFDLGLKMIADLSEQGELPPGEMLGEYRIVSLLGIGGMGEVYLAEDTALGRRVALKLIQRAGGSGLLRHFQHERRVLACLNHPNIARLYGSGVTPHGRAYLVIEYVEGQRLDEYCDQRRLGIGDRLTLFRKVCAAVAYAHQNLVIHRDLKPANIRVTADGEPKLLDFGIAKLLEPETDSIGGTPLPATVTIQGLMTPEYASPEQVRGETITTASDVYSLGVVLYELLSGERPYRLTNRRIDEIARAICDQEPAPPSSTAALAGSAGADGSKNGSRRHLRGDLDNIVAVAMRKEPARRYPSVSHLAEDIRRHCDGLPVSARRDTFVYRAGKFARRHKAAVAAAVLVLVSLIAGLVIISWEARRANRRFEDVRGLANYILFKVEPQIANVAGTTPARATLIKGALEYLDRLAQEAGDNRDLNRELATAYEKVGDVQGNPSGPNLGDLKGALVSYRKAGELRRKLAASAPRDARARQELADNDENLGVLLWWNNQTDRALESYHAALDLRRALLAGHPRSADFRRGYASVLIRLADVSTWNGQPADAVTNLREALLFLRPLAAESSQNSDAQVDLARCLAHLGDAHKAARDFDAALDAFTQSEAITGSIIDREPVNFAARLQNAYDLLMECETYTNQKTPAGTAKALALGPRVIATYEALVAKDPQNAAQQHNLANGNSIYGEAFLLAGRWQEALDQFQRGLAIDTRLAEQSPENGEYVHSCAVFHMDSGEARLRLGQLAEAARDEQTAQTQMETAAAQDPQNTIPRRERVKVLILEGKICERRQQAADARHWFQQAAAALETLQAAKITNRDDPEDLAFLHAELSESSP